MRKGLLALSLVSASALAAPAPEVITRNLGAWAPQTVTLDSGVLTVVTPQDRVTDQIYMAVLRDGVCGSLWMNPDSWSGVSEVKVLNRHAHQGYVFEGGEAECNKLGELAADKTGPFILIRTRLN